MSFQINRNVVEKYASKARLLVVWHLQDRVLNTLWGMNANDRVSVNWLGLGCRWLLFLVVFLVIVLLSAIIRDKSLVLVVIVSIVQWVQLVDNFGGLWLRRHNFRHSNLGFRGHCFWLGHCCLLLGLRIGAVYDELIEILFNRNIRKGLFFLGWCVSGMCLWNGLSLDGLFTLIRLLWVIILRSGLLVLFDLILAANFLFKNLDFGNHYICGWQGFTHVDSGFTLATFMLWCGGRELLLLFDFQLLLFFHILNSEFFLPLDNFQICFVFLNFSPHLNQVLLCGNLFFHTLLTILHLSVKLLRMLIHSFDLALPHCSHLALPVRISPSQLL